MSAAMSVDDILCSQLRMIDAAKALRAARTTVLCADLGYGEDGCPALEWHDPESDSWKWLSHEIIASALLDGLSVEDLTAVGG